jgi:uncharacterized delta-60 repeat protein
MTFTILGRDFKSRYLFACLFFVLTIGLTVVSARPGDLDNSFGVGGKVVTPIRRATNDYGYATAIQPDGKIIVAGRSSNGLNSVFTVSRFNPDGSFDLSFGQGGRAVNEPGVYLGANIVAAVALTPEGKIIVGGYSIEYQENRRAFTLIRYNADGTLDRTFGTGGIVQTAVGNFNSFLTSLVVQPNGKIVAAGYIANTSSPGASSNFAAVRYNSNGSLDTTFSEDGMFSIPITAGSDRATSVAVQPDNKIVLGGFVTTAGGTDFAVVRLSADGSFDTNFDGDGKVFTPIGNSSDAINSVAIQPDGKIVAAGVASNGTTTDTALARYNSDGSLDQSFDNDGKVITAVSTESDGARSIALQSDGKIVAVGYNNIGNAADFLTLRYNPDGSLDSGFDGDGIARTTLSVQQDEAHAAAIQADGKILAVGFSSNQTFDLALVRYNSEGSLDSNFGTNGAAIRDLAVNTDLASTVAVQPDGKIVAAGYSYGGGFNDFTVARYNANGALDSSFGNNGVAIASYSGRAFPRDLIIQPDGKIVIGGWLYNTATSDFALVRFNPDGSLDSGFGVAGLVKTAFSATLDDYVTSLALQSDGKIVAGGIGYSNGSRREFALARYNLDGSLDSSFDGDGKTTVQFNDIDQLGAIAIRPDGKIVASGISYNQTSNASFIAVAQLNPNGSLDTAFDGDGKSTISLNNSSFEEAPGLEIQPDGKLVIGASSFASNVDFIIFRLTPNGSLDTSFDEDGRVFGSYSTNGGQISGLVLQPDGKIVVGGGYYNYNGTTGADFALARFNPNGSYDTSFGTNGRVVTAVGTNDDEAYGIALQPDGKIVAAGYSNGREDFNFTLVRYQGGTAAAKTPFDFDGDGRADISVYRTNTWYIQRSQAGFAGAQWGASGDLIAPADYDGDGKTDYAVFRPTTGYWYILQSSNNQFVAVYFGTNGDLPRPADFDGDGLADVSVFRPSNGYWYRQNSSNNQFVAIKFGSTGDMPVIGDFDGDQKSDIAVFRPSNGSWYRLNSLDNQFIGLQFGTNGDIPAVGDFDGDGKSDISVFRPSAGGWYRLNSSDNQFVALNFGVAEDVPTPADYDGDGKSDVSVFRPSTAGWYRMNSASNSFYGEQFGVSTDQPAPAAFNQ